MNTYKQALALTPPHGGFPVSAEPYAVVIGGKRISWSGKDRKEAGEWFRHCVAASNRMLDQSCGFNVTLLYLGEPIRHYRGWKMNATKWSVTFQDRFLRLKLPRGYTAKQVMRAARRELGIAGQGVLLADQWPTKLYFRPYGSPSTIVIERIDL